MRSSKEEPKMEELKKFELPTVTVIAVTGADILTANSDPYIEPDYEGERV